MSEVTRQEIGETQYASSTEFFFRGRLPDSPGTGGGAAILRPERLRHYVDAFNANDDEIYPGTIRNAEAWAFLQSNIPLFECPDKALEEIYYFRWWSYRSHIRETLDGYVVTEFLPKVAWGGKHNSISCAAGHHFYEGRWLHDRRYLDDYSVFWLRKGGDPRSYSFWIADALWNRYLVTGDSSVVTDLFPDLVANYHEWEKSHLDANGLFRQIDDRDGMEMSVSGTGSDGKPKPGYRPSINSYMFGDAQAIARIADLMDRSDVAEEFRAKAARIKVLVEELLWNEKSHYFEVLPVEPEANLAGVRELIGYTPWYMNLPDPSFSEAWNQIMDSDGFWSPWGPTTVERRAPGFLVAYDGHECQWNGPSWPYATSITLTAMANLLNNYQQNVVSGRDYLELLEIYAKSQHLRRNDSTVVPWIDENLNPLTGDWLARRILMSRANEIFERGKNYNHSTYCDLIINGLVGLRPRSDSIVDVKPLVPVGTWDYFCLDNLLYHGHLLTIFFDRTGDRYGRGKGLRVLIDGNAA